MVNTNPSMVISIEGLNTAVEKIADFIHHPNFMKN
jgi:diacylglycerol kinase